MTKVDSPHTADKLLSLKPFLEAHHYGTDAIDEAAAEIKALREVLLRACLALEPIARRVFNDNGDHTINTTPFDGDVYSACYYASRAVHAALKDHRKVQT